MQIENMYICGEMKKYISILMCLFLFLTACNQQGKNADDAASIMQDSTKYTTIQWQDSAIDFGTKKMGEVVNITFRCTNTGKKALYLFDVKPGCGCTLVDYTKTPIEPGKQGIIEAKFDTKKSHPGNVHKTVYVNSNSSNTHIPYLRFSGMVIQADSTIKK